MANKTYRIGDHEAVVRMHDTRLVIKIEVRDREHAQQVYKDMVAKGLITPVRLS